jgi:hypothetical protein
MATAQMETAAQRYRRIAKEKASQAVLHDVECDECGANWKCRRPSLQVFVTSGMLPMDLAEKMATQAQQNGTPEVEMMKTLALRDQIRMVEFNSKIVKYIAVEPRIVETPSEPNDIGQEEVMQCCYFTLTRWAKPGGEQAEGLNTFRGE